MFQLLGFLGLLVLKQAEVGRLSSLPMLLEIIYHSERSEESQPTTFFNENAFRRLF
jgi:hypothetical protein